MNLLPEGLNPVLRSNWLPTLGLLGFVIVFTVAACTPSSKRFGDVASPQPTDTPERTITPCTLDSETKLSTNLERGLPGALSYIRLEEIRLIGGDPLTDQVFVSTVGKINPALEGFSPSGQWLAYSTGSPFEGVPQTLTLVSNDGQRVSTTPSTSELVPLEAGSYTGTWGDLVWINDETILVYILQPLEDLPTSPRYIKALLNPFTGEWDQSFLERLDRRSDGAILFSPDMTRVLFVSEVESLSVVTLWDLDRQEELWQNWEDTRDTHFFLSDQAWLGGAAWAPGSDRVAFTAVENRSEHGWPAVSAQGVYLLEREGRQGHFITDFYKRYGRHFTTNDLSWSPDGRYLAMSVFVGGYADLDRSFTPLNRLYLYDSVDDRLIDLCWLLGDTPGTHSATRTLVWSPDGQYIAYAGYSSTSFDEETQSGLVIVNIYTGQVAGILKEAVLLGGWSGYFSP